MHSTLRIHAVGVRLFLALAVAATCLASAAHSSEPQPSLSETSSIQKLEADPPAIRLTGSNSKWSLLVTGRTVEDRELDLTRLASYASADPQIATIDSRGRVRGRSNGRTSILIRVGKLETQVDVTVDDNAAARDYQFEDDIVSILSRYGCNSSGCHGKAEGQNGFKLSVFGFDPEADYQSLTMEGRGRRVFPAAPERSLLLRKAAGLAPHGGGVRIDRDSEAYRVLANWIERGLPFETDDAPQLASLTITPKQRRLAFGQQQQLRAVATYSDGSQRDVTALAQFHSNQPAWASVNEEGLVTAGEVPGSVAIMATFLGQVDTFEAMVARPASSEVASPPPVTRLNFIDELVDRRLEQLNIAPSQLTDDATFLRRVYLDLIGTLPTRQEARRFLEDPRTDRRQQLVNELLDRPEFATYWALKWSDLLRVDREKLGHDAAYAQYRWIRESIAANKPLDQFAREIIAAQGVLREHPEGYFFNVVRDPGEVASTLSQVFLGVRIECAQCHHHPFDRWSQADYVGMKAYFVPVRRKSTPWGEALLVNGKPQAKHPRTGAVVEAHPLGTRPPDTTAATSVPAGEDPRRELAAWMTSPANPYFARNLANRVWADLLGRGIVEPVDDIRQTNPPTNPELLDALANHLVEHDYDLRQLLRTIIASRTYQLSTTPNATNTLDHQNFSRASLKRLNAEVLLDAVCQVTDIPEKFGGIPHGYRAIELWDSQVDHYFLRLFGRPVRKTACSCERVTEPSVAQVLHLLNSDRVHSKLAHQGSRLSRLEHSISDDATLVDELYLTIFSRFPTEQERQVATEYLVRQPDRRHAVEDLAWSMMNSIEFIFNH